MNSGPQLLIDVIREIMKPITSQKKADHQPLIFIVEDDPIYRELIAHELRVAGYSNLELYSSGSEVVHQLFKSPEIILLDFHLGEEMDGLIVLKTVKAFNPDIQVIILSAQEKLSIAVNSMKYGAYDYVAKNEVAPARIQGLIERICNWNKLLKKRRKNQVLKFAFGMGTLLMGAIALSIILS